MRFVLAVLLLLAASSVAAQQTGRIRSIEHPNFSRLIFEVEPGSAFELDTVTREAVLTFPGQRQKFDADSVFDRISRSRILSLAQAAGARGLTVTLKLGCDCDVTVSEIAPGRLAMDVLRQGSRFGRAEGAAARDTITPAPVEPRERAGMDAHDEDAIDPPGMETAMPAPQAGDGNDLAGSISAEARLGEEARQLEQEILRIANAGLLERDQAAESPAMAEAEVGTGLEPNLPSHPPAFRSGRSEIDNNMQTRVETALDGSIATESVERAADEAECRRFTLGPDDPGEEELDIAKTIGMLRNALVRGDGTTDETAWRDLAQFYLSIGFGAEAEMILKELPDPKRTDLILQDIARITEGQSPLSKVFADGNYCAGKLALWRLASGKDLPEFDEDVVMTELAALPILIRKSVGLMVLSNLGEDRAGLAERITTLIERSPRTEVPPSEAELVGQLEDRARQYSQDMAPMPDAGEGAEAGEGADAVEPEAERHGASESGQALELDLGIAAREMNGTPSGLQATIALADVQAVNGEVLEAIELLNDALDKYEFGSSEIYAKGTEILLRSSERGDLNAQFVLAAMAGRKFLLSGAQQDRVNTRIAEIGLPNLSIFQ